MSFEIVDLRAPLGRVGVGGSGGGLGLRREVRTRDSNITSEIPCARRVGSGVTLSDSPLMFVAVVLLTTVTIRGSSVSLSSLHPPALGPGAPWPGPLLSP